MGTGSIEIESGQIRIHLSDKDPQIFKKILILDSKGRFNTPVLLTYEKHFQSDGKDVVEHYTNDEREMYFTKESRDKQSVTEGFGDCGTIFFREIKSLDSNNREVVEEWVWDKDDVEHYQVCATEV